MVILLDGTFGLVEGLILLCLPAIATVVPALLTVFYLLSSGRRSRVSYGAGVASLMFIHLTVLNFGGSESWAHVFFGTLDGWDRDVVPFLLAPRLATLFLAIAPVLKYLLRRSRVRNQPMGR